MPTSAPLFRRSFRLSVGDKQFGSVDVERPLSFEFSVERDTKRIPNNASVTMYNLSADTRQHLEQLSGKDPTRPGVTVRIEAGYGERINQIFFGSIRRVASWRAGADWITEVSSGDGEHEITTARISRTFVKGTPVSSVLKDIVRALGVDAGGLSQAMATLNTTGFSAGGTKLQKAITMHGDAAQELEQFCQSCGIRWSIQDGAFFAAATGEPSIPGEGPVFSPETGLLEAPKVDKKGKVSGSALLTGDLVPGRVFRVESSRVTGNFICTKVHHHGASFAEDWTTDFCGDPPAKGSRAAVVQ